MLAVNCQAFSFEAGNVRHEHEWKVWAGGEAADDRISHPRVVSHAPTWWSIRSWWLIDRALRQCGGTGTRDRGNGLRARRARVHPDIAWASWPRAGPGRRAGLAPALLRRGGYSASHTPSSWLIQEVRRGDGPAPDLGVVRDDPVPLQGVDVVDLLVEEASLEGADISLALLGIHGAWTVS